MREIKFRVWDKAHKKMSYSPVDPFTPSGVERIRGSLMAFSVGGYDINSTKHNAHFVSLQFTGLTDKNGKEVYEGDFISIGQPRVNIPVEFELGCFRIAKVCFCGRRSDEFKVVGNIYENPELLDQSGDGG